MNPFRHLLPHFRREARLFALGVAALLLTDLLEQFLPRLLKRAMDAVQQAGPDAAAHRAALWAVAGWVGLRVLFVALQGLLRWGWRMGLFGMSRKVEYGMRRALFDRLLTLDWTFYRRFRMGEILSRAMSDLAAVRESLGFGWLTLIDGIAVVGLTLGFMFASDARLSLGILWPLLAVPLLVATLGRRLRVLQARAQDQLGELSQAASESFSGARVLHAFARQEEEAGRFGKQAMAYRRRVLAVASVDALYWPLLGLAAAASEYLLLKLGGARMAVHAMSVGDFAMFQSYLVQIGWPVMALGLTGNSYIKGKVSVERLNEIYDARPEVSDPAPGGSAPVPAPGTAGRLEFRGVRCAYDPGNEVIRGFDLRVAPGEWVGLAGGVGSGKSTLLKLPPRLLDPTAGAVFLDGRDLREWPLRALRAQVALAAQEPFLFGETVLENVAFSRADEADRLRAEAEAALLAADLWETVRALPQGLDTLLGEKGVNLSGGQRRRLALARALFARPKVLLLDDVFSAVDTATEARIAPALRLAAPECAVLLVSHRVSTLRLCDRVLVLEAGGVVEEGSPDALIARGGRFREMAGREELARRAGLEG